MTVTLRPAQPADVPLILALIRELAKYERAPEAVSATEEVISHALFPTHGPPSAECLIGLVDGQPQGFAVYFHNFSTWIGRRGMYLEDLFVRPEARGAGLGKALLVRVAQIARERNCERLDWSVIDWNTPAIEFYTRLGAKPMSEWTTFRAEGPSLVALAALD